MKVRVAGSTAYISTTDIRQNFTTVYAKILAKYDTVVIEKNGTPIAVLSPPTEKTVGVRTEMF
jgi:PHD/YefM family antitoxin component YafN of YafNO toxin-antitoxin module